MKQVLHIISATYPYGKGEQFFHAEIRELALHTDAIVIYPLKRQGEARDLPPNVTVDLSLSNASRNIKWRIKAAMIPQVLGLLCSEIMFSRSFFPALASARRTASTLFQCLYLAQVFETRISPAFKNYFYSFWMNDGALILALLRRKKKIDGFCFRVNGYDLFEERNEQNYQPMKRLNYKMADKVFVLSRAGLEYLIEKGNDPRKLILAHYGIYANGTNPLKFFDHFRIVSCSNLIAIKRVDKIIDALRHVQIPIEWIHFGDGQLMDELRQQAASLPSHISVDFRGSTPNALILKYYLENTVHAFVHTSDTEGLGLVIIEAQSFGIPALAVAAGGVVDIVNSETGTLLQQTDTVETIARELQTLLTGVKNSAGFRNQVQRFWSEHFAAGKNYAELAAHLFNR